jgi:hypothetical protein
VELARANEAAVEEILTRAQLRRFKQIALQLQGPRAFLETDIATSLKLTAEQKDRIRAIEADSFFGMADQMRPDGSLGKPRDARLGKPHDGRPGKPPRPQDQNLRTATERIQALLTAEQAKRWREMTGESFKGSIAFCLPSGPFGPPPRPKGPSGPFGPPR